MNFINFAKTERRIDPTKGKYSYFPNQQKDKVVSPKATESESQPKAKVSNANSRTPTRGNAAGMKVARNRGGSASNVYKKVSDVSGRAYQGAIGRRKNTLGAKVGKAIQGAAKTIRFTPGKAAVGLSIAGGLGYAASRALQSRKPKTMGDRIANTINSTPLAKKMGVKLRKMRSDKGKKRK